MTKRVIAGVLTSFLLASVVGLSGCTANKELEKLADKACACADKDCANKVADEFVDWMKKNKDARGDEDKAKADAERMAKCLVDKGADLKKLMDASNQ
jgi:hypothetical protein